MTISATSNNTQALKSINYELDINTFNSTTAEDPDRVSKKLFYHVDEHGNLGTTVIDHVNELNLERTRKDCLVTSENMVKCNAFEFLEQAIGTIQSGSSFAHVGKQMYESLHALSVQDQLDFNSKKSNTLNAMNQFLDSMKSFSSSVQDMRMQSEKNISEDLKSINSALKQIADYNLRVLENNPNDYTRSDVLRQGLNELSSTSGFHYVNSADGTIKVYSDKAGRYLLVDHGKCAEFSHDSTQNITPNTTFQPITVKYEGVNYEVSSGNTDFTTFLSKIKGSLSSNIYGRDTLGTSLQDQINKVAVNLSSNFNEIHNMGTSTVLRNQVKGSTAVAGTQLLDATNMTGKVRFALMDQNHKLPTVTGGVNYMDVDLSTFNAYVTANAPTTTGTMNDFVAFLNSQFSTVPALGITAALQNNQLSLTATNTNYGVVYQDTVASQIQNQGSTNPTFFGNFFGLNDLFTNIVPANNKEFVNFLKIRSDIEQSNGNALAVGQLDIPSTATGSNATTVSIITGTDIAETLSDIWKNQQIMFSATATMDAKTTTLDAYCEDIIKNQEALTQNVKKTYEKSKKEYERSKEIAIKTSKIDEKELEADLPKIMQKQEKIYFRMKIQNQMMDELMNLSGRR